jgi:transcriptional regulator with XRE-family HTH domain
VVDEEKYSKHEVAFAQEVSRRREQRGWTLQQMADALRREGIDYASAMTVSTEAP